MKEHNNLIYSPVEHSIIIVSCANEGCLWENKFSDDYAITNKVVAYFWQEHDEFLKASDSG